MPKFTKRMIRKIMKNEEAAYWKGFADDIRRFTRTD
jgi:hypothetical protein